MYVAFYIVFYVLISSRKAATYNKSVCSITTNGIANSQYVSYYNNKWHSQQSVCELL